jgi:rhamnogalacturonan acetylesterase
MKSPRHPFLYPVLLALASTLIVSPVHAADDERPVENAAKHKLDAKPKNSLPTIFLEGDSTVRVGSPNQRGWGDELAPFFDTTKINVLNHAIGGRSSRTFQTEGRWDQSLAMVQRGDFVICQFGHNDNGPTNDNSRARGTLKGTGEETEQIDNILTKQPETVHTYGWYMRKYAHDAKLKGATVVICSPIPRKSWKDGKMGRASGDYGKWAREAAAAEGVMFIDLNEIIAQGYEKLGPEKVEAFFGDPHTHTSVEGAKFNAGCVVAGLKGLPNKPFDRYFAPAAVRDIAPFDSAK